MNTRRKLQFVMQSRGFESFFDSPDFRAPRRGMVRRASPHDHTLSNRVLACTKHCNVATEKVVTARSWRAVRAYEPMVGASRVGIVPHVSTCHAATRAMRHAACYVPAAPTVGRRHLGHWMASRAALTPCGESRPRPWKRARCVHLQPGSPRTLGYPVRCSCNGR